MRTYTRTHPPHARTTQSLLVFWSLNERCARYKSKRHLFSRLLAVSHFANRRGDFSCHLFEAQLLFSIFQDSSPRVNLNVFSAKSMYWDVINLVFYCCLGISLVFLTHCLNFSRCQSQICWRTEKCPSFLSVSFSSAAWQHSKELFYSLSTRGETC